jgi:hypothetical protein
MKILIHRVNSIAELIQTSSKFGVEVDVYEHDGQIYTGHDPRSEICQFKSWVQDFKHDFLAVNIKQEGIELEVIEILESAGITNFFLFDLSFPMLYKLSQLGESRLAVRVSDIEGVQALSYFKDRIDWVWLDAFADVSFIPSILDSLSGFKVCVVSPELHSRRESELSAKLLMEILSFKSEFSAVCTKKPEMWAI